MASNLCKNCWFL